MPRPIRSTTRLTRHWAAVIPVRWRSAHLSSRERSQDPQQPEQLAADPGGHLWGQERLGHQRARPARSTSPPADGQGHIGFAAQPGLALFGNDIFTDVPGVTSDLTTTVTGPTTTATGPTTTVTGPTNTRTETVTAPTRTVTTVYAMVPYLIGDTLSEAKAAIDASGLRVGTVTTPKDKKGDPVVASTSPKAGSKVKADTTVSLTLRMK